jgi:hypothetical protein
MNAHLIAKSLGGRKAGASWLACCPAHNDRLKPSLSIRDGGDGRALVRCHAGCDQQTVIAALRARGLWGVNGSTSSSWTARRKTVEPAPDRDDARRTEMALAIWRASRPAPGTLVEVYLAARGIHLPPPGSLRFSPALKHPSGGIWRAMIALVTSGADGTPLAIHRTFLACDGSGKAPVDPPKMMLGACRGGAVRLGESGVPLLVAEGIETALSGMQMSSHPAWAALSTSGLRALDLPAEIRDVIVLADGDDAGEAAALASGRRWKEEGRRVRIARPGPGRDFNDILLSRASRVGEGARQ